MVGSYPECSRSIVPALYCKSFEIKASATLQTPMTFNIAPLNFRNLVSVRKNVKAVPSGVFRSAITFGKAILCRAAIVAITDYPTEELNGVS